MTRPKPLVLIICDGWGYRVFLGSLFFFLLISEMAQSQMPSGFHWIDFKQEVSTVSKIEQALKAENYTAIREIGISVGFALVITVRREPGQATPDGDQWVVYSVSTDTMEVKTLLNGYNLQIKDWTKFESPQRPDLSVAYTGCWECEPGSLFTAIHYEPRRGWRARWPNEKDISHPGIPFLITDVGDSYTDEDVDQVFAVLAPLEGVATGGTWYRSRDLPTGKVTEIVSKFYVDPVSGKDKSVELEGSEVAKWKLRLCKAPDAQFAIGQTSKACKRVLSTRSGVTK
jgi:hypothetical protein